MQARTANNSHRWRITSFAAAGLTSVAATLSFGAPAQAADVSIKLSCQDERKTFLAKATLNGSGAPTAKYDVQISVYDRIDDTRAPKIRLVTLNKDNTVTQYRWRTGDQGRAILTKWDTTLQEPKGLTKVSIEATTDTPLHDSQLFNCFDFAPK